MACGGMGSGLAKLWALAGEQDLKVSDTQDENKKFVKCPECNWEITGSFTWCPKCGTRLKPFQCAYCNSIYSRELSECPLCGAPAAQEWDETGFHVVD